MHRYIGLQLGTKSARGPAGTADEPRDNREFCFSIDLHVIFSVSAYKETFSTVVHDTLKGERDGWLLDHPTRYIICRVLQRFLSYSKPFAALVFLFINIVCV